MEVTPLYWILLLFISRVAAGQSPGSLIVRPNRSQFFEYESVSLSCEVQGGSTGRRVERNPTSGKLTECGDGWGRFDGTNCIISSTKSTDSGVYWCGSGKHKNTVNITVTADFYKDGSLIRTEYTGEMTIPAVSQSDQGLYSCRHPELGRSPESWMTVTAATPSTSPSLPPPPSPPFISPSRLLCSLLVVSPYLVVTTVLMVKYSRNRNRA
ncbi:uncharacterized protein LOC105008541 isoform X2 [Esox lucius]|uniref:uncharacterized protein LOC105008541 isoform X2 n=1 Tax=Esox lucius TaxID=8010 RepID=UPI00147732DA|nr:uncharacterized protein LOC105008541 isoform X2 [Esox lucius]